MFYAPPSAGLCVLVAPFKLQVTFITLLRAEASVRKSLLRFVHAGSSGDLETLRIVLY